PRPGANGATTTRGTMIELLLAAAFLIASHYGISSTPLRDWLVDRLGERPYLGLYSVIALIAIVWLSIAYAGAPYVELWPSAAWMAWVPLLLMPVALIFLVSGVSSPNPTAVGAPDTLDPEDAAHGILRITRHPVMWAIALFALSHIIANGDFASVISFGTFAALALIGTLLLDRKYAARRGSHWRRFAEVTSNVPFGAIAAGRQRIVFEEIGWPRIGAAFALYIALLALHTWLFGVSPMGAVG
ncbi:MAG: NnrU family protein, partial [Geminicoccales bacterium]